MYLYVYVLAIFSCMDFANKQKTRTCLKANVKGIKTENSIIFYDYLVIQN